MVRSEPTAEAWFAAIRERNRLGIAMAAIIKMIATTINNSISEKPRESFLILFVSSLEIRRGRPWAWAATRAAPRGTRGACASPGQAVETETPPQVITQRSEASPRSGPGAYASDHATNYR